MLRLGWIVHIELRFLLFGSRGFLFLFKRSRRIPFGLEVLNNFTITMNLASFLKLWLCCWKYLRFWRRLFSLILNAVSSVLTILLIAYCIFHQLNGLFTFAVDIMVSFKFSFYLLADKCRLLLMFIDYIIYFQFLINVGSLFLH